jgi:hypothetical protein
MLSQTSAGGGEYLFNKWKMVHLFASLSFFYLVAYFPFYGGAVGEQNGELLSFVEQNYYVGSFFIVSALVLMVAALSGELTSTVVMYPVLFVIYGILSRLHLEEAAFGTGDILMWITATILIGASVMYISEEGK